MTVQLFELPSCIPPEDVLVIEHILTALQNLEGSTPPCVQYKVDLVASKGYLLHATLPAVDPFEITLDDLLFLRSIHPARVERIAFARALPNQPCELLIHILDASQPVMVSSTVVFFSAARKRKFELTAEDA